MVRGELETAREKKKKNMALNINLGETDRYRYANNDSDVGTCLPSRAN